MLAQKIVSNINRIIKEKGRTQTWLAKQLDMPQSQFSRYMTGKVPIPIEVVEACSNKLDCPLEEFFAISAPPSIEALSLSQMKLEAMELIVRIDDSDALGDILAYINQLPPVKKSKFPASGE